MRGWLALFLVIMSLSFADRVLATDQSSLNFKNDDSTFAPAAVNTSSSNFHIDGSVEAITGMTSSTNFFTLSGTPVNDPPTTVTPPPPPPPPSGGGGGGGGGGGYSPSPPSTSTTTTVSGSVPTPTLAPLNSSFKSHQVLNGSRANSSTTVLVNGSDAGVTYPSATTWQKDLPLQLGFNLIRVQARGADGTLSFVVQSQVERLLIGDINRDHHVDDVDLSLFTRAWSHFTFFADFNEDHLIDDVDLSLLVSHWGLSD